MTKKSQRTSRKKYKVDVLTPVYGGAHFVRGLAKSLLEDVDAGVDFHWILIDDATPKDRGADEVREVLKELREHPDVSVIFGQVNGGFSHANNLAASKGRAPLILMLNSDILAKEDGWMARMVEHFEKIPQMGVVGARLLFFEDSTEPDRPAGRVQHAGVGFDFHANPYHIFMGWSAEHPKVMKGRAMRAVTGACLMTRRKLWRQMGGLQTVYTVGNFEDVEYCVQLMNQGFIVLYDPEVCLYHYGSGSENTATSIRNRQIFGLRNGHLITWDDWLYY